VQVPCPLLHVPVLAYERAVLPMQIEAGGLLQAVSMGA
jgi:hypothetical protein